MQPNTNAHTARATAHAHAHGYDSDPTARTAVSPPRWPTLFRDEGSWSDAREAQREPTETLAAPPSTRPVFAELDPSRPSSRSAQTSAGASTTFVLIVPPSELYPVGLELRVEHRGGGGNVARTQWFHIERRPLLDEPFTLAARDHGEVAAKVAADRTPPRSVEAHYDPCVDTRPELPSARTVAPRPWPLPR